MPWNEPGGGKGGDRDPWKGGNGQQPPDLDEVFANMQRRLRRIFGGKGGSSGSGGDFGSGFGGLIGILLVALVVWIVWDSVHIIDESQRGVVLRFGEYNDRTLQPGLNFTFPRPIESVYKVNVRRVRSISSRSRMLTGDENLIDVNYGVQYRVQDPENFLFNVREPEISLGHAADSAIREIIGTNNMDFILEVGRGQIATDSQELLQEIIERYESGMVVTSFNLEKVEPPNQVQAAFDDVVEAREDQIRFANEAQAYANRVVPEARGRAARVIQEAEGYRESVIALAGGEADRFTALLTEYTEAPEVTRKRLYIQTLEQVFSNTPKVLMDVSSGNNMFYLPLDRITGTNPALNAPPPLMTPSESERMGQNSGSTSPNSRGRSGREGR